MLYFHSFKRGVMKKIQTIEDCDLKIKSIKRISKASKAFFWLSTLFVATLALILDPLPGTAICLLLTGFNCGTIAQDNLDKLSKDYLVKREELVEEERLKKDEEYKYQSLEMSQEELDILSEEKKSKHDKKKKKSIEKENKDENIDDNTF